MKDAERLALEHRIPLPPAFRHDYTSRCPECKRNRRRLNQILRVKKEQSA